MSQLHGGALYARWAPLFQAPRRAAAPVRRAADGKDRAKLRKCRPRCRALTGRREFSTLARCKLRFPPARLPRSSATCSRSWSVVPFAVMLLAIAVMPLLAPGIWEHNRNKAILSFLLGAPIAIWTATLESDGAGARGERVRRLHPPARRALRHLRRASSCAGTLAGTPGLNAILLGIGAVLASLIGTTGASMLLVRPLLRANSVRALKAHVFVFFIFVVANAGGLLTPMGDPPLFLGFLRGVPFTWTLRLWREWLFANGILLILFYIVDSTIFRREDLARPADLDQVAVEHQVPVSIAGKRNLLYLAGVVARAARLGHPPPAPARAGRRDAGDGGALLVDDAEGLRAENGFTW